MTEPRPRAVVALGGNALLPRGAPLGAAHQAAAARAAARALAPAARGHRLVVTHGNGPQIGLLALREQARDGPPGAPLDVLGSETEGQLGYLLETELDDAIEDRDAVTVITRVLVDADDPAFAVPTKPIGPHYGEPEARELARRHGWTMGRDGDAWRRVVASPQPRRILPLAAIARLVDGGFVVVCAGGGGVPVVEGRDGRHHGVEAVIDKDLTSALLAEQLGAPVLVLATDVDAVYAGFGTPGARPIGPTTPRTLRSHHLSAGSMGPKVEAACRFVTETGGRAAIGALGQVAGLLDGSVGTQVHPDER